MNSSGLLFNDLALVCFYLYVFNGGCLATLVGWVFCVAGWKARDRWLTFGLGVGCLAPVAYIFALSAIANASTGIENSNTGFIFGMGGFAISAIAAPVAAFLTRRQGAPS